MELGANESYLTITADTAGSQRRYLQYEASLGAESAPVLRSAFSINSITQSLLSGAQTLSLQATTSPP